MGEELIVEAEAYGGNGVPGEGVGDRIFLARNMLQGTVELGYRRQVTLLTGRMRVRFLGEGVDKPQVVCLDGEG